MPQERLGGGYKVFDVNDGEPEMKMQQPVSIALSPNSAGYETVELVSDETRNTSDTDKIA